MDNFNFDDVQKRIEEVKLAECSEKTQKVARLIILLLKIETELKTVKETLLKLKAHQAYNNPDSNINSQIDEKLSTVDRLTNKIVQARLNLNFYFI